MTIAINADYLRGLLHRALLTSDSHEDASTRARADEKIRKLAAVLEGMSDGSITVGSRTPVASTPAWATLEVVKGGFATGSLLAAGDLLPHERALLDEKSADLPKGRTDRARLNLYFVGERGMTELLSMVASGCYRVNVPEEGALLVAAWLLAHDERAQAWAIIDVIAPFFDRLRFYPVPDALPLREAAVVRLLPVSSTIKVLGAIETPPQVSAMNETLRVWIPLEDRLVALFAETIVGGSDASPTPTPTPLLPSTLSNTWRARARALLDEYHQLAAKHTLSRRRHTGSHETLARLLDVLRACAVANENDAHRADLVATLARVATKRGLPGSSTHAELRARQSHDAALPTRREIASTLTSRLAPLPPDAGLPSTTLEAVSAPLDDGTAIPASLVAKLERSLEASIEELVERGVIPSSEVLAVVAPQITAQVRAAGIDDVDLRRLYGAVYAAFRRRRSLLLLNLEHQVRIEELPWVSVVEHHRKLSGTAAAQAATHSRLTLEQMTVLALTSFPEVILPNKLLTELVALAKGADVTKHLPIVEELAADIFMGTFTPKFVAAAKISARLLRGTIYDRYYDLDVDRVLALPEPKAAAEPGTFRGSLFRRQAPRDAPELAALCVERADRQSPRAASSKASFVATNGRVIEQEQILTTHNLAALVDALGLVDKLGARMPSLARASFQRLCSWYTHDVAGPRACGAEGEARKNFHAELLRLKSAAYAWRQMVFFLALSRRDEQDAFLAFANAHLASLSTSAVSPSTAAGFASRLAPAMRGLALVVNGGRLGDAARHDDDRNDGDSDVRRFLGWTVGRHWLLPPKAASASA